MNDLPTVPMPADLNAAIATEPAWLQLWLLTLVLTHMAAVFFIAPSHQGKIKIRMEAVAIVLSFVGAAITMTWLYDQVGYVRLLGIAHIVFWLPVYVWLMDKYRKGLLSGKFEYYVLVYFAIAGLSLLIDVVDVIRYLSGDTQPLHLAG